MFDRVEANLELDYNSTNASRGMQIANQIGMENALKDVDAAISYAGSSLRGKKVGIVGYCFGGTLAWLAGTRLNPHAAVCYYGGRIAQYAAEAPRCPVMLHFGTKDKHIPPSEMEKIQRAHPELPVFLYDAGTVSIATNARITRRRPRAWRANAHSNSSANTWSTVEPITGPV
jgi:carboxymethylenebutenolidase